jgi:hypothetical protein
VAKNETKRTCSMHTTFYWIWRVHLRDLG